MYQGPQKFAYHRGSVFVNTGDVRGACEDHFIYEDPTGLYSDAGAWESDRGARPAPSRATPIPAVRAGGLRGGAIFDGCFGCDGNCAQCRAARGEAGPVVRCFAPEPLIGALLASGYVLLRDRGRVKASTFAISCALGYFVGKMAIASNYVGALVDEKRRMTQRREDPHEVQP